MPALCDTHCHLKEGDSLETVYNSAVKENVAAMILVASTLEESTEFPELVTPYSKIFTTAGLHPHEADSFAGHTQPWADILPHPKVCAIGEIGLDYHYEHSDKKTQRGVFEAFIQLAGNVGLPAVIHCREAYEDCYRVLKSNLAPEQRVEIHSFSGSSEWIEAFQEFDAYFSFNGMLTFKNAGNIRTAFRQVPIDRLLLETDTPYLAPVPYRGKSNHPAYLPLIAECAAQELGLSIEELVKRTTENARRFFNLNTF